MLDTSIIALVRKYQGPNRDRLLAVCLGDQRPTVSTGYASTREFFYNEEYAKFVDIDYNGQADVKHNLNLPLPLLHRKELAGNVSLLYDGGVCEHVANIGQALVTVKDLLRVGGVLIQCVPVNAYGGSYYGIDPALLHDFYTANGFTTLDTFIVSKSCWRVWLMWKLGQKLSRGRVSSIRALMHTLPSSFLANPGVFMKPTLHQRIIRWLADDYPPSMKRHSVELTGLTRRVPEMSMLYYVGKKVATQTEVRWPCQGCYPEA
jgi:hypothetical protein